MRPPDRRILLTALTVALLVGIAFLSVLARAMGTELPVFLVAGQTIVSTVLIGSLFVRHAPDYTERATTMLFQRPGGVLLFGLLALLFVGGNLLYMPLILPELFYTIVAAPILVGLSVLAEFGWLAVGRAFTDRWTIVLGVAGLLSGVMALFPLIYLPIGAILSIMGIGSALLAYHDDAGQKEVSSDREQSDGPGAVGSRRSADGPNVE